MESTDKFERRLSLVWSFFSERGFGKDDLQGGGRVKSCIYGQQEYYVDYIQIISKLG